jgi:hypothetical protein
MPWFPRLYSLHVKPMKADETKEHKMTIIDFALLAHALAHLISALARLIVAKRQR